MDIKYLIKILESAKLNITASSLADDPVFVPNYARLMTVLIQHGVFRQPSIHTQLTRLNSEIKLGIFDFVTAIEAFKNSADQQDKNDITILRLYLSSIFDYVEMCSMFPIKENTSTIENNVNITFQEIITDLLSYLEKLLAKIIKLQKVATKTIKFDSIDIYRWLTVIVIKLKSYQANDSEIFQVHFINSMGEIIHRFTQIDFFYSTHLCSDLKTELMLLKKYLDCLEIKALVSDKYAHSDFNKMSADKALPDSNNTELTPPTDFFGSVQSTLQIGNPSLHSPHEAHQKYSCNYCLSCYPNFVRSRARSSYQPAAFHKFSKPQAAV